MPVVDGVVKHTDYLAQTQSVSEKLGEMMAALEPVLEEISRCPVGRGNSSAVDGC